MPHFRSPTWSVFLRWLSFIFGIGLAAAAGAAIGLAQDGPRKDDDDPPPPRKLTKAPELDGGTAWLNTGKPLTLEGPQGQGRPARLLDPVLHQLHPRPARPGEARKEVRQRTGRHRRPLAQVREREGHREHPQGDPALRDQAPGRQRRRPARSGTPTACSPGRRSS